MIKNDFVEANDIEIEGKVSDFIIDVNDIESESKIWKSSIEIYSNQHRFITEIVSNAYDATVEKAELLGVDIKQFLIDHPIIVRIKDNVLEIEESNGMGISPDRINDIYLQLGKTTKDKSITQIGAKGIGKMSPLAYTDSYFIVTRYNGVESGYTLYKYTDKQDSLGNVKRYVKPRLICNYTDVPTTKSGTLVRCNVDNIHHVYKAIEEQLMWFNSVFFVGHDTFNKNKLHHFEHFVIADNYNAEMIALLEKVPYRINWKELGIDKIDVPIALKFSTSELSVNQSREELLYNNIQYIYDENNNLVVDIDNAIENGKLKPGYTRVVKSVKDIILEKIELAKEELRKLYKAEKQSCEKVLDYYQLLLNNTFRGKEVSAFINEWPTIKGLEILNNNKSFTKPYYLIKAYETHITNVYKVNKNSITERANADRIEKFYKVKDIHDGKLRKYLRENYVGAYILSESSECELLARGYELEGVFTGNGTYLKSLLRNNISYGELKWLLKRESSDYYRAVIEFFNRLKQEVLDVGEIVMPDSYIPSTYKSKAVRTVDKGECVYYEFEGGYRDRIIKQTISINDLNTISQLPIIYTTRGSISYLDDFKKLDCRKVKVIFLAESFHKYISGIKYEDFMNNPEQYDLGKEIATNWYLSEYNLGLRRLEKVLVSFGESEYLDIVRELLRKYNSTDFHITDSLSKHIGTKVANNDVSIYKEVQDKLDKLNILLNKNPILDLLFNTSVLNSYSNMNFKDEIVPFIKKHIKL